MIDPRGIPAAFRMAVRATAVTHLAGELFAVRVFMAIHARLRLQVEVVPRSLGAMTAAAGDSLMFPLEREFRATVLLYREARGPESMLIVASGTVRVSEGPAMRIPVTVAALLELQAPIPFLCRKLRRMTAVARDLLMQALEREVRKRMRAQPDLLGQARPADTRMAVFAPVAELGLVHLRMARNAIRSLARRLDVAGVVAGFTFRLGVPGCEAESRVIGPNVRDIGPIGLVVAGRALGPREGSVVRVFVTGDAIGLQPKIRRRTPPVLLVVAVLARRRPMGAFEGPAGLPMLKSVLPPARPANELRLSTEMLDVTTATGLVPILARGMETKPPTNPNAEVVVASEAGIRVEPLARRMTFAAVRVAVDLGVSPRQFPRRQELCARRPWNQHPRDRSDQHHQRHDRKCRSTAPHCEKIHRYPYTHATPI